MKHNSRLWITTHKGKLEGIASINTSPLVNDFCASMLFEVCESCYARRLASFRRSLEARLEANFAALQSPLDDDDLPRFRHGELVRFHSFGELGSVEHARNLMRICALSPDATFAIWTKRPELLTAVEKPANCIWILSIGKLNATHDELREALNSRPRGFDGIYAVGNRDDWQACGDECATCLKCYGGLVAPFIIRQRLH